MADPAAAKTAEPAPVHAKSAVGDGSPGASVTVACKVPAGLILKLFRMVDDSEMTPLGPRAVKRAQQIGRTYRINGSARNRSVLSDEATLPLAYGYALTPGIPKAFWDEWVVQNADADVVVNKLIFAHEKVGYAHAQAKEQQRAKIVSGLEPVNPKELPKSIGVRSGLEIVGAAPEPAA